MKKKAVSKPSNKRSSTTSIRRAGFASLIAEVRSLVNSARQAAATAVNNLQVLTNFEIGCRIVEHEQQGAKRAAYGTELLNGLSAELTQEFGSGFSTTNLRLMRQFFIEFSGRLAGAGKIHQTLSDEFLPQPSICQTASDKLPSSKGLRATSNAMNHPVTLSWSHFVHCYDRRVRLPKENPTVGLVLCKQKKAAVVDLTLPKDSNIHARQYQLYLPAKELLQQKLFEWTRDEQEQS